MFLPALNFCVFSVEENKSKYFLQPGLRLGPCESLTITDSGGWSGLHIVKSGYILGLSDKGYHLANSCCTTEVKIPEKCLKWDEIRELMPVYRIIQLQRFLHIKSQHSVEYNQFTCYFNLDSNKTIQAINIPSQSTQCFRGMEGRGVIWLAVELKYQQPFAYTTDAWT